METDGTTPTATPEADRAEPTDSNAQDSPGAMITLPLGGKVQRHKDGRFKSLTGKNIGNSNGKKHGMSAISIAWRNKLPIDHKTKSGKVEQQVFNELVQAFGNGDTDKIDPVTHIQMQMVAYDCGRWHQHRLSKKAAIQKLREEARKKGQTLPPNPSPKILSLLESYEQPTINSLRAGLTALGKPPASAAPKLQDILDRIANGGEDTEGSGDGTT
jgi:hypothetical protein